MKRLLEWCISGVGIAVLVGSSLAQQRVPATPLITHDPYFSIWSTSDALTDSETTHWTGSNQSLKGIASIDGKLFRFMGKHPDQIPTVKQTATSITPTHTRYHIHTSGSDAGVLVLHARIHVSLLGATVRSAELGADNGLSLVFRLGQRNCSLRESKQW